MQREALDAMLMLTALGSIGRRLRERAEVERLVPITLVANSGTSENWKVMS